MKKVSAIIFLSVIVIALITLSVLGNIERKGYLEVVGKNDIKENQYQVKLKYYSKFFRNNDIYGVFSGDFKLPSYVDSLEFESNGSPFAQMHTKKNDIENGFILADDVPYKLKIKISIYLYAIFIISLIFIIYQFKKASKLNIFYSNNEILEGLSKTPTKKNIFYISGIVFIGFIFLCFWYNKFYYALFHFDSIAEGIGIVINFKFPEFFWSKTYHLSDSSYWYNSRWTGNLYTYLFYQTIPKIYTFFGGDVVKSIFVTQGLLSSSIYVSLFFVLTLYIKEVFNVKLLSKHFVLFLIITNLVPVVIESIVRGNSLSFFVGIDYMLSRISNYSGCALVLLIALFPYWRYFLNNKWDDWYNNNILKVSYYLIIILTAFSGPAITAFYFSVSFFILFVIVIKNKSLNILNNKMIAILFSSIFLSAISMLLEKSYINRLVGSANVDKFQGIKASIIIVVSYIVAFFIISVLPVILSIKFSNSKNSIIKSIKESKLNKNIFLSLIFCLISMLIFLALASIKNRETIEQMLNRGYGAAFYNTYLTITNLFFLLSISISIITMLYYVKQALIKAIILMFLISHFIFYISYIPGSNYNEVYRDFNLLHEANKNKTKDNVLYIEDYLYNSFNNISTGNFGINITSAFAKQLGIIDKNVVIKIKRNNVENETPKTYSN